MRKVYSHLSAQERIRIDELRNREGLGVRQIALRMGRDKSTVSRELRCGLWFASDENESHRPYRPKQLKTGAWTSRPFYSAMTAQRKAERRARQLRKPMRMAYDPLLEWVMTALPQGMDARTHRGTAEGRMAVRPAYEDQLRMPLPVDLRQAAQGIGPQAVPAAGQAASHARQGQEVEGVAHPDARADRRQAQMRGLAPRVRPL
ncbi:integrase, catalytic region [Bifidobacterium bifidum]|nr:integrase, catalytic region [Bifidobacterium bifidum]